MAASGSWWRGSRSERSPGGQPPLRIVVADDQASVREGLVVLLGLLPDIEVVGAAANGEQALTRWPADPPDAILLDLHMPVLDGIETTRRLTALAPGRRGRGADHLRRRLLGAGRPAGRRAQLHHQGRRPGATSPRRCAAPPTGLAVLDPAVQSVLLAAAAADREQAGRPAGKLPDRLTQREAEILAMIARGMANPDIAAELFLSAHTIKSHINRIFAKTGSPDRAAAIRYARDHGLG